MSARNKVTLVGRVGNAPEIKVFESNKKLARIVIAINESYKNQKGERVTETTWHNITLWGQHAELCQERINKGTELMIEGKLVNRNWKDKDGKTQYKYEVQVNDLILLGGKPAQA